MIALHNSVPCAWLGCALMGLGMSSMYGAGSGHVLQYIHVRHIHVSVIVVSDFFIDSALEYLVRELTFSEFCVL